jgi:hypothetical protein
LCLCGGHAGPDGQPGEAFFGVDYDYALPYSYWDDNRSIPFNPVLGTYYPTGTGIYNFEYYINPYDYWYGTYQVFRNAGQLGGSGGRPGADGADTYLMLICNPDGFYEVRSNYKVAGALGETIVIEETVGDNRFRIEMTRTQHRPASFGQRAEVSERCPIIGASFPKEPLGRACGTGGLHFG